jgi:uncharacterized protein YndB with AHSA1/START domain
LQEELLAVPSGTIVELRTVREENPRGHFRKATCVVFNLSWVRNDNVEDATVAFLDAKWIKAVAILRVFDVRKTARAAGWIVLDGLTTLGIHFGVLLASPHRGLDNIVVFRIDFTTWLWNRPVMNSPGTDREIELRRTFRAPRELLFRAWTDPAVLTRWWGPKCFTNPVCEVVLRVGGASCIVIRSPEGMEFTSAGVYQEIVPNQRLVYSNEVLTAGGSVLMSGVITVAFDGEGNSTTLTLRAAVTASSEITARVLERMEAGWLESLESLAEAVEV